MLERLGHVGLWSGLYVGGAVLFALQMGGVGAEAAPVETAAAVGFAVLTATAAYALDRVKLRDSWIDPADGAAQPERYAFLRAHSRAVRAGAIGLFVLGAVAGLRLSPWAPVASALSLAGVMMYAPRPRGARARPKDLLWVKNLYVGAGITGFAVLVAVASALPKGRHGPAEWGAAFLEHGPASAWAAGLLLVRTVLDAALCDIDDEPTDRAFGTATAPTVMGGGRVWLATGALRAVLAAATLLAMPCPWRARAVWGVVTVIGMVALRVRRPRRLRDPVDLRLAGESALAAAALWAWG